MPSPPAPTQQLSRSVPLSAAIAVSLLIHAGLGVALGIKSSQNAATDHDTRFAHFNASDEFQQEPRTVQLGDPDARTASLTWIGYEEFEEMWAPESEIDQAEQSPEPAGSPTESERPTESTEPDQPEPIEEPPLKPETTQPDESDPSEFEPEDPASLLGFEAETEADRIEMAGEDPEIDPSRLLDMIEALEDMAADLPRFNPIPALLERQARRSAEREASPTVEEPAANASDETRTENSPNTPVSPRSGESGLNADREADAAAVNPVKRDELDKPLVAQGLTIQTVRPSFSNVTRATARPRNPIVQLDFRRNGVPLPPRIIRSTASIYLHKTGDSLVTCGKNHVTRCRIRTETRTARFPYGKLWGLQRGLHPCDSVNEQNTALWRRLGLPIAPDQAPATSSPEKSLRTSSCRASSSNPSCSR